VIADLPDRRADLAALAAKVEGLGRGALPLAIDVRDRGSVDAAMAEVAK
jgi:NADP-dependent 3-hydroxy acid dehydrogenase YdfG